MLAGAALLALPWFDAARWQGSPEAVRAVRNAEAPTPVWLTPTSQSVVAGSTPQATIAALPTAIAVPTQLSAPVELNAHVAVAPSPTPATSDLLLGNTAFVFDDPPEPGARAHLDVSVDNPSDQSDATVTLVLPTTWLAGYKLESTEPSAQSGEQADGSLRISFEVPRAETSLDLSLAFVTTDEVIDAPNVTVVDADGRTVGQAHPATEAPKPRP